MKEKELIFEMSRPGRIGFSLPECDVPEKEADSILPAKLLRKDPPTLPELSEADVVRHFTHLSMSNFGVDSGFYPLGSCTMKYNPKMNEAAARLSGFANVHPLQAEETAQGCLELMYEAAEMLSEITGMGKVSLQPAAGAHGEMCGLMIIKAYHENRGDFKRRKIIVPDSAHGTNPASAALAGFDIINVKSDAKGMVDIEALSGLLDCETAGLMLTNPNTVGIFDTNIKTIADMVHKAGGLLYYDGANMNAIMENIAAGRHGIRRSAFKPAQDFQHSARRRGTGGRPCGC